MLLLMITKKHYVHTSFAFRFGKLVEPYVSLFVCCCFFFNIGTPKWIRVVTCGKIIKVKWLLFLKDLQHFQY